MEKSGKENISFVPGNVGLISSTQTFQRSVKPVEKKCRKKEKIKTSPKLDSFSVHEAVLQISTIRFVKRKDAQKSNKLFFKCLKSNFLIYT